MKIELEDLQNNALIKFLYEDAFDDIDNYVIVVQDGKMGYVGVLDKIGVNTPCKYNMMGHFNKKGYTAASQDGKWGVIDVNDNVLVPFIYDRAYNPGYKDTIGLKNRNMVTGLLFRLKK